MRSGRVLQILDRLLHCAGEPLEEGRQPEQPAADTEQVYHVEEPEQSSEEAEAPAEPPQKAPKGREPTKKTAMRSAAQVSHAMCFLSSVHRDSLSL